MRCMRAGSDRDEGRPQRHAGLPGAGRRDLVLGRSDGAARRIEPGDTVVLYPADGAAALAILQSAPGRETVAFASLEGERFEMAARDIAALHLAAVDDEQSLLIAVWAACA